jgi:hypothetical protein
MIGCQAVTEEYRVQRTILSNANTRLCRGSWNNMIRLTHQEALNRRVIVTAVIAEKRGKGIENTILCGARIVVIPVYEINLSSPNSKLT